MSQIVVAEIEAYDPAIYGTRTLRFSTEGFSTTGAPLGDPVLDSRFTVTRSGEATRINGRGLVETVGANRPRFDYDPVTRAIKGLLIEETRQNLMTYSEQCWNTSFWGVGSTLANFFTVTNSTEVANVYGTSSGVAKFVANPSTAVLFLRKLLTLAAATYAPSIFIYVPAQAGVNNWQFIFDAADVEQSIGSVQTTFGQWVRVTAPAFATAASRGFWDFNIVVNGTTPSPGFTFYAMGPQLEAGSTHTSYIPTVAAAVTRNVDLITMTGANFTPWYNAAEGTLFAEWDQRHTNVTLPAGITDGTTANRFSIVGGPAIGGRITVATVTTTPAAVSASTGTQRSALAFKSGDSAQATNGVLNGTFSPSGNPAVSRLELGVQDSTLTPTVVLNGHMRRLMYWPTRLTNAQLQQITSGQSIPSGMRMDLDFLGGADSFYEARIMIPPNVKRECFTDGRTFGRSQIGYGDMVLVNNDGGLDYMLGYSYSGRRIVIRLGTLQPNGLTRTWSTILVGSMEQAELSWQQVTVKVRDRLLDLAKPLQQVRYAGGNALPAGLEGNDDDLRGRPKPLVYGAVFNITPPCVNTARFIYQIHTGGQVVAVNGLYDRGALMTAGAAYSSQADMEANAPSAGQYRVWNDATLGCFVRLGSNPTGTLTADVTQGASRTVGQLFQAILQRAGMAASDINLADIAALDTAVSFEVGVYAGVQSDITPLQLLDELCASVGAWYGTDINGVFRIGRIVLPTGTSLGTITTLEIIDIERIASRDPGVGVPAWKVKLGWQKVQTVQSDLNTSVTVGRKTLVAEEYRRQEVSDENVRTINLLSPEIEFDTVLVNKANALTEANRRLAIYKERRDMYKVTVRVDAQLASILDLGNIITLQINRFGMTAGKKFLIIGVKSNMSGYLFELTLWG